LRSASTLGVVGCAQLVEIVPIPLIPGRWSCSLNPDLSERCEPSIRWFRGEARDSPIAASDLPLPDLPLPSGR
jgi:hypothetical protein